MKGGKSPGKSFILTGGVKVFKTGNAIERSKRKRIKRGFQGEFARIGEEGARAANRGRRKKASRRISGKKRWRIRKGGAGADWPISGESKK